MRRIAPVVLALAAVSGLAGCTTTSAGQPRAQESGPTSSEARPREIPLDDVSPCDLIPQEDYSDFYLEEPGKEQRSKTFDAPACAWTGTEVGYFSIVLVTNSGVEQWLDGSITAKGAEADPIADFPTYTVSNEADENACFVTVDVADGQQLLVQVGLDPGVDSRVPPVCDYAHEFATSAMSTLVDT